MPREMSRPATVVFSIGLSVSRDTVLHMKTTGPTPRLTREGTALRKFALSFPDAHEDFPWGHLAAKIGKKAFVFISGEGGETSMSTKLPQSGKSALKHSFARPTEYGLGKHGWVTFTFARGVGRRNKKRPVPCGTERLN